MPTHVFITDYSFASLEPERAVLADCSVRDAQCKTAADVIAKAGDAEALIVQWAPITAEVLDALPKVRLVVRYGIGVDNVEPRGCERAERDRLQRARLQHRRCGRPRRRDRAFAGPPAGCDRRARASGYVEARTGVADACVPRDDVRRRRVRSRIGRSVLERARPFKFKLAAYDPVVPAEVFEQLGVRRLELDELFREADILSLHSPLLPQTKHLVNAQRLAKMKPPPSS